MNPKTTNLLLVGLLLVGAYFILFERKAPTTFEREQTSLKTDPEQGRAVFTSEQLPTESVVSVTVQRGSETVELVKEGQDWFQHQPVRFTMNTWSVRQMVDDAAALRYFQRFDPAKDQGGDDALPTLEQVDLSTPRAIVTLRTDRGDSPTQKIMLGRPSVGGRAYAMFNDDQRVHVINDALHRQVFDQGVVQWRNRSIDAPTEGQAKRLVLVQKEQAVTIDKIDGRWSFGAPHDGRVDHDAVSGLLAGLRDLYIQKFVVDSPEDDSVYGLDQPRLAVSVDISAEVSSDTQPATSSPGQGTTPPEPQTDSPQGMVTKTLRVGAATDLKNEHYFATWPGDGEPGNVVFTVSASVLEQFAKSVDDLRDARLTPIAATDVRELTIQKASDRATGLVRGGDGWSFLEPGPGYEADSASASQLVESITGARASGYQPRVNPLGDPVVTVTIESSGRSQPDVLRIYAKSDQETYPVLRNDESTVYLVAESSLGELFEPTVALRNRTVLGESGEDLAGVTIKHKDGPTYIFERIASASQPASGTATQPAAPFVADSWQLVGYEGYETEALDRVLSEILPLRAGRWVAAPASGGAHDTGGGLTVTLAFAAGEQQTLIVDPDRALGRVASESDDGSWFELNRELAELLAGEFRLRTVLPADIGQIDDVQIIRGNDSVSIRRDQANQYVAADGITIDQSVAGSLFDTLAGLRVDRFIEPQHISVPPLRIVLKTVDGQAFRLAFSQPNDPLGPVTNGDQWFRLGAGVLEKLNAAVAALAAGDATSPEGR